MLHLNDREHLGKFDSKSDQGVFLGYSNNSRAYRVYNMRTQIVMEPANVVVGDHNDFSEFSKEELINNFTDEVVVEFIHDKQVEEPIDSIKIETGSKQRSGEKSITTKINNQSVVIDKI